MCLSIRQALEIVFEVENIKTRDELVQWCHYGRSRLYSEVRTLASEDWNRLATPESSVRVLYEHILSGYKCHTGEYKSVFK
jgi:hypothetical protein